ncbi:hypothetical protein KVT40_005391 [Elsinoe batatas]|uniref:Uncharacterized protein n=1 Tax=Elsinoe batatas TaxID=2601811 RepID=A0A8K0PE68_9PEZI|nr:hypothetical protein KVT40_005391 [Elsinoe batatas]
MYTHELTTPVGRFADESDLVIANERSRHDEGHFQNGAVRCHVADLTAGMNSLEFRPASSLEKRSKGVDPYTTSGHTNPDVFESDETKLRLTKKVSKATNHRKQMARGHARGLIWKLKHNKFDLLNALRSEARQTRPEFMRGGQANEIDFSNDGSPSSRNAQPPLSKATATFDLAPMGVEDDVTLYPSVLVESVFNHPPFDHQLQSPDHCCTKPPQSTSPPQGIYSDSTMTGPGSAGQSTNAAAVSTSTPSAQADAALSLFNHLTALPTAGALEQLLLDDFDAIAVGSNAWMYELRAEGSSEREIANIYLDDLATRPWIEVDELADPVPSTWDPTKHVEGCIHYSNVVENPFGISPDMVISVDFSLQDEVRQIVEEKCGLAGIKPKSVPGSPDGAMVRFDATYESSTIEYLFKSANGGHYPDLAILGPIVRDLKHALGALQEAHMCCNILSFILRTSSTLRPLQLCELSFQIIDDFVQRVQDSATSVNWNTVKLPLLESALAVLGFFPQFNNIKVSVFSGQHQSDERYIGDQAIWHLCTLATQFLCVATMSYAQSHIRGIQPYFLDTEQKSLSLNGSGSVDLGVIRVGQVRLACLHDMFNRPVLAFSTEAIVFPEQGGQTLSCNARSFLDSFGSGRLIVRTGSPNVAVAINVNGGLLYKCDAPDSNAHWTRAVGLDLDRLGPLNLSEDLIIGSILWQNDYCHNTESVSTSRWKAGRHWLGTSNSSWHRQERQAGVPAAQYLGIQSTLVWHKDPAVTLKDKKLDTIERLLDIQDLLQFLEEPWGLQVSMCTSVARRVKLRFALADLVTEYRKREELDVAIWKLLDQNAGLHAAMRADKPSFRTWLRELPHVARVYLTTILWRILQNLRHTGVDKTGTAFLVALPTAETIDQCLEVPLVAENAWLRLLGDSRDAAVFAYMSLTCLCTEKIGCPGDTTTADRVITMLGSEFTLYPHDSAGQLATLKDAQQYYLCTSDSTVLFKAKRTPCIGDLCLVAPLGLGSARIFVKKATSKDWRRHNRIRERRGDDEGAEAALVYSRALSGLPNMAKKEKAQPSGGVISQGDVILRNVSQVQTTARLAIL